MNLIIIATGYAFRNKNSFSYKISEEFKKIHTNNQSVVCNAGGIWEILDSKNSLFQHNNTIIHLRQAHPNNPEKILKRRGFLMVNNPKTNCLTSHKINTMELLKDKIYIPNYLDVTKVNKFKIIDFFKKNPRPFFIKGIMSGTPMKKRLPLLIDIDDHEKLIKKIFASKIYFNQEEIYIQTLFNFDRLYRVILIDQKAIATFVDFPDKNHMASVCLNKKINFVKKPDINLLNLASLIQKKIKADISYIDIFWSKKQGYALSEINSACDLLMHEKYANINIAKKIAENLYKKAKQKLCKNINKL